LTIRIERGLGESIAHALVGRLNDHMGAAGGPQKKVTEASFRRALVRSAGDD
jgi:hypothetical protein